MFFRDEVGNPRGAGAIRHCRRYNSWEIIIAMLLSGWCLLRFWFKMTVQLRLLAQAALEPVRRWQRAFQTSILMSFPSLRQYTRNICKLLKTDAWSSSPGASANCGLRA